MNRELYLDYKELLEKRARELHAQCGFARPPYDPWIVADHCNLNVRDSSLDDGVDGYLEEQDGIWCAYISVGAGDARRRFTLAHELGHLMLVRAAGKGAFGGLVRYRSEPTWAGLHQDPFEERLCNAFATELLIPTADMKDRLCRVCISPQTIMDATRVFSVSVHMAARKVVSLFGESWTSSTLWDLKTLWPVPLWQAGMRALRRRDLLSIEALVGECAKNRKDKTEVWTSLGRRRDRFKVQVALIGASRLALCFAAPAYEESSTCAHRLAAKGVAKKAMPTIPDAQLKLW